MNGFKHFVLTNFNVNFFDEDGEVKACEHEPASLTPIITQNRRMSKGLNKFIGADTLYDKNGNPTLDNSWLKERKKLFEKYCLPSVLNQTSKNFYWLIRFDKQTPESFYEDYLKHKNIYIIFESFKDWIDRYLGKNSFEYVITSRLDNDDCYHKEYIKEVQKRFEPKTKIIDVDGYQYVLDKNYLTQGKYTKYNFRGLTSPFFSLIEPAKNIKTVYCHDHLTIHSHLGTNVKRSRINKKLFLQTVHKKNVANTEMGAIVMIDGFGRKQLLKESFFNETTPNPH